MANAMNPWGIHRPILLVGNETSKIGRARAHLYHGRRGISAYTFYEVEQKRSMQVAYIGYIHMLWAWITSMQRIEDTPAGQLVLNVLPVCRLPILPESSTMYGSLASCRCLNIV